MADINARIVVRQGLSTLWASVNPVMQAGEIGYETDLKRFRIGDGVTPFVSLPSFASIPSTAASRFPSVNGSGNGLTFSTAAEFLALLGITATATQINGGLMPAGAVIFHAGPNAPAGFLKANGAAVSRTTYAALWAAIGGTYGLGNGSTTFNVPDMRGLFARGLDEGRGLDVGRALGTYQDTQNLWHQHTVSGTTSANGSHAHALPGGSQTAGNAGAFLTASNNAGATASSFADGVHTHTFTATTAASGGDESRPRNMALLACIKF